MAVLEGKVGPQTLADGPSAPVRLTKTGASVTADAQGKFTEAVSRGNVYYLATAAAAGTAFTGGAGGTPLIGIYNPTGSGRNLAILAASHSVTAIPTAAGVLNMEISAGVSVLPTGTVTNPKNMLTQQRSGSVAVGFVNTAMTGSTAITYALSVSSFSWETAAASSLTSTGLTIIDGLIVVQPGVLAAIGLRTIPTALTTDIALFWEEVAI